jgi:hypothetical protein
LMSRTLMSRRIAICPTLQFGKLGSGRSEGTTKPTPETSNLFTDCLSMKGMVMIRRMQALAATSLVVSLLGVGWLRVLSPILPVIVHLPRRP